MATKVRCVADRESKGGKGRLSPRIHPMLFPFEAGVRDGRKVEGGRMRVVTEE